MATETAGTPGISGPLSGKRVLLVEDEMLVAMDLQFSLEDAGATVIGPVGRLDEAIEKARSEKIDVAILDVQLGSEEVFPAAEILAGADVPIVFHSGHHRASDLTGAFAQARLVRKPCDPEALVEIASTHIRSAR